MLGTKSRKSVSAFMSVGPTVTLLFNLMLGPISGRNIASFFSQKAALRSHDQNQLSSQAALQCKRARPITRNRLEKKQPVRQNHLLVFRLPSCIELGSRPAWSKLRCTPMLSRSFQDHIPTHKLQRYQIYWQPTFFEVVSMLRNRSEIEMRESQIIS